MIKKLSISDEERDTIFLATNGYKFLEFGIDDSVGDYIKLNNRFNMDLGSRDAAFVMIDGTLLKSQLLSTHGELVNQYIKENIGGPIDGNTPFRKVRSVDNIEGLTGNESVIFGHIIDDVAFIEAFENCSEQEAVSEVSPYFSKVYIYNTSEKSLERVADINLENMYTDTSTSDNTFPKTHHLSTSNSQIRRLAKAKDEHVLDDLVDSYDKAKVDKAIAFAIKENSQMNLWSFVFRSHRAEAIKNLDYRCLYPLLGIELSNIIHDILDILPLGFLSKLSTSDIRQYIDDSPEVQDELTQFVQTEAESYDCSEDTSPIGSDDLLNNEDNIGETIDVSQSFTVDIGAREAAFVYVDGKILIGENDEIHSDIINKYLGNSTKEKEYIRGDEAIQLTGDERIGFGHISNNIAFIETCCNVSPDEIKNALEQCGQSFTKIYSYDDINKRVQRLARRI